MLNLQRVFVYGKTNHFLYNVAIRLLYFLIIYKQLIKAFKALQLTRYLFLGFIATVVYNFSRVATGISTSQNTSNGFWLIHNYLACNYFLLYIIA